MAPPNVFSYLRPNNRRPASASSPDPNSSPSPSAPWAESSPLPLESDHEEVVESAAPISPIAPSLPRIPRVASYYDGQPTSHFSIDHGSSRTDYPSQSTSPPSHASGTYNYGASRYENNRPPPRLWTSDHLLNPQETSEEAHQHTISQRPRTGGVSSRAPHLQSRDAHLRDPKDFETTHELTSRYGPDPSKPVLSRSSKTKLHLLNPMTLLSRRRVSHNQAQTLPESSTKVMTTPGMRLPDDYDPRIHGRGIHDFSAPRPRNNVSPRLSSVPHLPPGMQRVQTHSPERSEDGTQRSPFDSNSASDADSPRSSDREYTPAFTEHFGYESSHQQHAFENHRVDPRHSPRHRSPDRPTETYNKIDRSSLPPFARKLPSSVRLRTDLPGKPSVEAPSSVSAHASQCQVSVELERQDSDSDVTGPQMEWSERKDDEFASFVKLPAGLPRHLTSSASRFSFDLAGVGSAAQEKLLEEKHMKKSRKASSRRSAAQMKLEESNNDSGEESSQFSDYDDYDGYDDGLEEKIPGVNTDAEEESMDGLVEREPAVVGKPPASHFDFHPTKSTVVSPLTGDEFNTDTHTTPRDDSGHVIGLALSKEKSPSLLSSVSPVSPISPDAVTRSFRQPSYGLGLVGIEPNGSSSVAEQLDGPTHARQPLSQAQGKEVSEDDLYFDDGLILAPDRESGADDTGSFDETVFDRDFQRATHLVDDVRPPDPESNNTEDDSRSDGARQAHDRAHASTESQPGKSQPLHPLTDNAASMPSNPPAIPASGLTQNNLAAYHDALVAAANAAAVSGKFAHRDSVGTDDLDRWDVHSGRPRNPPDEQNHISFDDDPVSGGFAEGFDDDELDDDPMIAAANAEALENDAEGLYGQEFGFYAQSNGTDEAHYVNGGYFGPKDAGGLSRSQSGHAGFREPNLTPITERSEYSNRNSLMSLPIHGVPGQAQSMQSPGLAQLAAGMMGSSFDDEDMSLSALMRLRRGAWSGSQASLHSVGSGGSQVSGSGGQAAMMGPPSTTYGGRTSRPAAARESLHDEGSPVEYGPTYGHSSVGTVSDLDEEDEDDESSTPPSPTLTYAHTASPNPNQDSPSSPKTSLTALSSSTSSPVHPSSRHSAHGHSRSGSGGDIVSYVKMPNETGGKEGEEGKTGGERWILERRRTGGFGEVTILGRSVVEGGRI
ncbi:MAG: hypothetical protein M1817_003083 [Caeruleum heppii]|nr:MAG: hypothetical protein M1817_003083 [Caeruleum heppii]